MEAIIKPFRAYLANLIDDEQQLRGLSTRDMLVLLQGSAGLPEFYRIPAHDTAAMRCTEHADEYEPGALDAALQEAIKAVYGAWIREHYRDV